ncbi:MarR family transcriptional regulator [Kitasatospora sp. NPDC093806]|uniref:MarR family winged helix-turn-helix transcriptional regulator n=1 Tax=Kitasatospora sp. NPDC093806 TaxID=3155075 RepID=UPI00342BECC2
MDAGADDLLTGLLPRISQLSGVLSRGRLDEHAMAEAGLSLERPAMSLLVTLRMAGGPLRVGEIATRMQVVGPHVTRQINGLEKRGLVRRVADPDDQRARLIEPTPEGAEATDRYLAVVLGWLSGAMAGWSEQDRQDFGRLLGRFADDLTARVAGLDAAEQAAGQAADSCLLNRFGRGKR